MKKFLLALLGLCITISFSYAEMKCAPDKCGSAMKKENSGKKMKKMFQTVAKDQAVLLQEGKVKAFCPECGMTLPMFYKTNHAAQVEGKTKQYCSIHCLVEDMKKGSDLKEIKVVDTNSLKFIDALKAFYVVGSKKKGTMSTVSKYAFSKKRDANLFAKENGGHVVDFRGALEAAKTDFSKDTTMISKKQKMMRQQGKLLYNDLCQKTDKSFSTTAEAKAFILSTKLCNKLNGKQLQAIGLYLKSR